MAVTLRAGTKRRLLAPVPSPDAPEFAAGPWYVNDHTLIRAEDGRWHVFGIWHPEPAAPLDETFFLHASAPSIEPVDITGVSTSSTGGEVEWTVHPAVLHARTELGETHVWAPHVVQHDDRYWMFYCGGTTDHSRYRIELATSTDLHSWQHDPDGPLFEDGYDARDPMVVRDDNRWLLYYTRTSRPDGGFHEVAVRSSTDLRHWSDPQVAYRSTQSGTYGGPTESPFVVRTTSGWVLFVCESGEYDRTLAYFSTDPERFDDAGLIEVDLDEHCAEILDDGMRTWITGGGWDRGGLTIRPLEIIDQG